MKNATSKVAQKYICVTCHYETSKKSSWIKHCDTKNHKEQQMLHNATSKVALKNFVCNNCNKYYKHSSSLYRHKKICNKTEKKQKQNNEENSKEQNNLEKELQDVKNMLHLMTETQLNTERQLRELKNNTGNTTNNNMTINVYLNEYCKNAMNLDEFLQQLQISVDDLMYTTDNGYVKGISNIFMKNMKQLEPNQRPIHCSDKKRLQFYIKDEDKWEKDKNNKLDDSINAIRDKQIKQIKAWEKLHPNWNKNEKETQMYINTIQHVMGGASNEIVEENTKNIKKQIGNTFDIKDIKNIE